MTTDIFISTEEAKEILDELYDNYYEFKDDLTLDSFDEPREDGDLSKQVEDVEFRADSQYEYWIGWRDALDAVAKALCIEWGDNDY